jgi:hypothetical protein
MQSCIMPMSQLSISLYQYDKMTDLLKKDIY